jgi:Galactose-3-O-sulfotransferase
MTSSNETLIFLHLPKVGGMTLDQILERRYPRQQIYSFDGRQPRLALERFQALPEAERARFRLIRGHLAFGLHNALPNPSTYITFLRNPVERAISQFYYAKSRPEHYLYARLHKEGTSLYEYAAQRMTPEISNQQTSALAGLETQTWEIETTRTSLEAAKKHLQTHFRVVGVTEQFDTGLLLLQRAFGWTMPVYLRENATAEKPPAAQIDPRARALIAELNALDIELYAFARELFDAQCRAYGNSLQTDLAHFRQWNARYQQFVGPVRRWRLKFARSVAI